MAASFVFAGSRTTQGYVDAVGEDARFQYPTSMVFSPDEDCFYVCEYVTPGRIRRVNAATAEVTTALIMDADTLSFSMTRHPISGNFYVCSPYDFSTGDRYVYVYDPDWTFIKRIATTDAWFAHANDDETILTTTESLANANAITCKVWQYDLSDGSVTYSNIIDYPGGAGGTHQPFLAPAGVLYIGDTLYWAINKNNNRGLFKADGPDLNTASASQVMPFTGGGGVPGPGIHFGCRTLHIDLDDPNRMYFVFAPDFTNDGVSAGTHGGSGIDALTLDTYAWTQLHAGEEPNGGGGTGAPIAPGFSWVCDYLLWQGTGPYRGREFATSSGVAVHPGGGVISLFDGPHCIETWDFTPTPECEPCVFEYPYRWSDMATTMRAGAQLPAIVSLLSMRDRELASRLTQCGEQFDYPHQWEDIAPAFLDPNRRHQAAALLEQNDAALELHLLYRSCSLPFEYPYRWAELMGGLWSENPDYMRDSVAMLEERDRLLEDRLGQFP